MTLSAEDNLRLNVLLMQTLYAVRIDESKMVVYALTAKGEAKIPLNATGKDESYIKEVKALFSTHVIGSAGGYPVFLKRWARMGQARDESLAQMLLLGEPEAVIATVHAKGLTDELAARAWWIMPTAENARCMLARQAVVEGETGRVLANFLMEFLPFEEAQKDMIESVRLVLQPGLISATEKEKLWAKAKTKRSFYVGFLHACADHLPIDTTAHDLHVRAEKTLLSLGENNNPARLLLKILSASGQAFLQTVEEALEKPNNQDVVISLLDAIARYFKDIVPEVFTVDDMGAICKESELMCCGDNSALRSVITAMPEAQPYLQSMMVLACLNVKLLNPIFARTDAIGTLMRKKIKPITDRVSAQLNQLQN